MRDPQRIEKILNILRHKWYEYPDLRLGQLLLNCTPIGKDLFYLEDEDLVEALKGYQPTILKPGGTS